jgi:6-phosphogluconolactonase (cycloisomerase 2 family)
MTAIIRVFLKTEQVQKFSGTQRWRYMMDRMNTKKRNPTDRESGAGRLRPGPGSWLSAAWGLLAVLFLLLAAGCSPDATHATASLNLRLISPGDGSRTLLPQTGTEVAYYTVSGSGPEGSDFSLESAARTLIIPALEVGSWDITASGWNAGGRRLYTGSTEFTLDPDHTDLTLTLAEYYGTGSLAVTVTWDQTKVFSPRFDLFLTPEDGTEEEVEAVISAGSAAYESSLDAGTYLLRGILYSSDEPQGGFVETVRIADSDLTGGTIVIDLDLLQSDLSALIIDPFRSPVEGTITGIAASVILSDSLSAAFIPDNITDEESASLYVTWYLNGIPAGTGTTLQFTPELGPNRLDAVAVTNRAGSAGSSTLKFTVLPPSDGLIPVSAVYADDNVGGNQLDGAEDLLILPDGLIITAAKIDDAIQTFRIENGSLVLKQTYSYTGSNLPLNGVRQLTASDDGSLVFALSEYSSSLTVFSHLEGSDTLSFIEDFTGGMSLGAETIPFGTLNTAAVHSATGDLYVFERSEPQIFHFMFEGTATVPIDCYQYLSEPALANVKKADLSPDGLVLAAAAADSNALFLFAVDPVTRIPVIDTVLSYGSTGTMGVSGINDVLFLDDTTLLTTSTGYLCEFRYGSPQPGEPETWYQSQRISEGGDVIFMSGPKAVTANSDGSSIYVSCSISDGITVFTRDALTGLLTYEGFISTAPFDPNMTVVTADGLSLASPSPATDQIGFFTL